MKLGEVTAIGVGLFEFKCYRYAGHKTTGFDGNFVIVFIVNRCDGEVLMSFLEPFLFGLRFIQRLLGISMYSNFDVSCLKCSSRYVYSIAENLMSSLKCFTISRVIAKIRNTH